VAKALSKEEQVANARSASDAALAYLASGIGDPRSDVAGSLRGAGLAHLASLVSDLPEPRSSDTSYFSSKLQVQLAERALSELPRASKHAELAVSTILLAQSSTQSIAQNPDRVGRAAHGTRDEAQSINDLIKELLVEK
jgi:hypothetical protein